MTEMHPLGMVVATPAKLRADTTAQRQIPRAALIATLTARATGMSLRQCAAMAPFQVLKPAMTGMRNITMVAVTPAELRLDGYA
jgi:hypothetical protein